MCPARAPGSDGRKKGRQERGAFRDTMATHCPESMAYRSPVSGSVADPKHTPAGSAGDWDVWRPSRKAGGKL